MNNRNRTRLVRILLPVLGLALVFSALGLYRAYGRPAPESLEEYYRRLYPNQLYVGPDLDKLMYSYPMLMQTAKAVLVVTPEEDLAHGGTGYSEDKSYAGTNPRLKYHFYRPRTWRWVKVLQVLKGTAEPGDRLGFYERCVLVGGTDRLLVRSYESWPMVKGCVYLVFLDRDPTGGEDTASLAITAGYGNGWFDLTHLGLNDPVYRPVLASALKDLALGTVSSADDPEALDALLADLAARWEFGDFSSRLWPDPEWNEFALTTPWTDHRFPLAGWYAEKTGEEPFFDFWPPE